MTVTSLVQGSIFAGRYRVVRCIAHGGMGAVYEVVHIETERRRALKVMLPNMIQSQEMQDRFRLEARVTASIESEFIVDVSDAGIDEATQMPFLVMEFLRGEELSKRLKRLGRFEPQEVVTYLGQAAMALDKTHQASIVHRDLKPGNLFLTERDDGSPRIKVLDFGIAKLVAEHTTQGAMTQSLGTPLYMAPEQFKSGQRVSPASDIYSLAMLGYHLLVGKAYWASEAGENVYALIAAAVHGPQESARARAERHGVFLPPAFDTWFFRAASVQPTGRFATAGETIIALADALGVEAPNRRRTMFPDQQRSQHHSIAEIVPPSRSAPAPYAPVGPITPAGLSATGGPPPSYGQVPDSRRAAPVTGGHQAMTPMPASVERSSVNPRSGPGAPQGASPVPGPPISSNQPAGTSTGAFSHTSAGFPSPDRPKNQKAILITAAVAFTVVVGTLTVILAGSGKQPDAGGPAASPETPIEAPPAPSAAPTVTPGAPIPAEVAAPIGTAEPPVTESTAAGATSSKPKTSDTGAAKTSRPPQKTTKPNVVYSPD